MVFQRVKGNIRSISVYSKEMQKKNGDQLRSAALRYDAFVPETDKTSKQIRDFFYKIYTLKKLLP